MKSKSFLLGTIIILFTLQLKINSQVTLIPKPREANITSGSFSFTSGFAIKSTGVSRQLIDYTSHQLLREFDLLPETVVRPNFPVLELKIDNTFLNDKPEAYSLKVTPKEITILSSNERGVFYGVQTLLQILVKAGKVNNEVKIYSGEITDYPQYSWRGLNLDCSRHFMSKEFIKRYIEILAFYKFNTFHWHLTDDQGWRIEIKKYPKLTEIGAWRKEADGSIYGGYYTQQDIKEIVAYAKERFINIVPEIEMPGHSLASLASYPENSCTGGPFEVGIVWGVMKDIYCAGRDSTFYFLQDILDEVTALFPGKYVHIGGDEAPKDRWKECSKCQARIKSEGLKDEHELQSYFIKRIAKYLRSKGKEMIGWDEILQGGLAEGAIVQSWQSFMGAYVAAKQGHYTICSPASYTYLNSDPDNLDLRIAYSFNPVPDELNEEEKKFVLGSEVNLWTEEAPEETVDSKLFPRILAFAEVFWSNPEGRNYEEFYKRVQASYKDLDAMRIKYGRETKVFTPKTSFDSDKNEFVVELNKGQAGTDIYYSMDGSDPDINSILYNEPIRINKSVTLNLAAFRNKHDLGKKFSLSFDLHKALNAEITIKNKYDERYRASGDNALIDGVRATENLHDGCWQGYEGVDFEAVIDLGEEKEISKVSPRFMLNSNSWIFLPEKVTISIAEDEDEFMEEKTIVNDVPQKNSEIVLKDFTAAFNNKPARYIKVKAESIKKCPDWHPGAGGKAWLFIDEIVVE
ncbi:MAG: beta-N-acetylhexosaminidase [Ignavibacteriales bacterium]|nr:MAG: beta-N-acetylhexosaminidase [Ignavibacteriales bacterium]